MRIIGYVRVSTADQAAEGISLDAQRGRIAAWGAANGGTLDGGDVYEDAGLSGKRADNRPGLQAALDAVCQTRGVLVVYSLSRLARSTKDTIGIADRLDRSGADLVSLSERIDTTSASGKMVFRLLAVLAEFERDLVSERTRAALAHKRHKGERIGQVPYGRRVCPDGRTLETAHDERRALAEIRRHRAAGWSLRRIAKEMTRLGVPTKNGGPSWSHTTVAHILDRDSTHAKAAAPLDPVQAHPELSTA